MRDKLIYDYEGVDVERVWLTLQSSIPSLLQINYPFSTRLMEFRIADTFTDSLSKLLSSHAYLQHKPTSVGRGVGSLNFHKIY